MAHKLVTKAEAKAKGLKTYYTGKPCPKGHIDEIFVNGRCRTCTLESTRKIREARKAKTGKTTKSKAVAATVVAVTPITYDWRSYADRITATWQQAVESIIATGKLLIEAKAKLRHGEFEDMLELVPFGERTMQMLVAIAENPVLSDPNRGSVLPPSWRTLYELSRVPDDVLLAKIEDHTINPDMQRRDIKAITDETGGRSKSSKRVKAHIAEVEAEDDRRIKFNVDPELVSEADDDLWDTLLEQLAYDMIAEMGEERVSRLTAKLQRLLGAASDTA